MINFVNSDSNVKYDHTALKEYHDLVNFTKDHLVKLHPGGKPIDLKNYDFMKLGFR